MKTITKKLAELKEERTLTNLFSILCDYGDNVAAEYFEDDVIKTRTYSAVSKHLARLRFCLTSEHKSAQLDEALDKLDVLYAKMGITK